MPSPKSYEKLKWWRTVGRFSDDGSIYCKAHPTTPRVVDAPSVTWCKECKLINRKSKDRYDSRMRATSPEYKRHQNALNRRSLKKRCLAKKAAKQELKAQQRQQELNDRLAEQAERRKLQEFKQLAAARLKLFRQVNRARQRSLSKFTGPCSICGISDSTHWTKQRCKHCYSYLCSYGIDRDLASITHSEADLAARRLDSALRRLDLINQLGSSCSCGESRPYLLVFDPPSFKRKPIYLVDLPHPQPTLICHLCALHTSNVI